MTACELRISDWSSDVCSSDLVGRPSSQVPHIYSPGVSIKMKEEISRSCRKRLARIEGQVRGIARMVEEDRYCIDVITQIQAVRAALPRVEEEDLKDHVEHYVEQAVEIERETVREG